jgi:hypothetical protein
MLFLESGTQYALLGEWNTICSSWRVEHNMLFLESGTQYALLGEWNTL